MSSTGVFAKDCDKAAVVVHRMNEERWKTFERCIFSHIMHGNGIFTYIYHKNQPNVGKYTIHGCYGFGEQAMQRGDLALFLY